MKEYLDSFDRKYYIVAVFSLVLMTGFIGTNLQKANPGLQSGKRSYSSGGPAVEADLAGDSGGPDLERKKATSFSMEFEVPDVRKALEETSELAESSNGYVESSRFDREDGQKGYLTVKIPENNSKQFLKQAEGRWKLESKNKNVDDVTDRYTELELELENKRTELRRLEKLMNRTDDTESLVKIQERMSELRTRIQELENRLKGLDRRVEYTEIRMEFSEPEPITAELELRETVKKAYQAFFDSIKLLIVGVGYLLPLAILLFLIKTGLKLYRSNIKPQ